MGKRRNRGSAPPEPAGTDERAGSAPAPDGIGERRKEVRPSRRRDSDELAFNAAPPTGSASHPSAWKAALAVAIGAVALGSAPFVFVLTQSVDPASGRTGLLFAVAFLCSALGIVPLPKVCFGFLAPGSEGVTTEPHTGNTITFRHTERRARRALRWVVASIVVMAACFVAMPRLP